VLSHVDDLYTRMLEAQDPDADGYSALVGLRTMVRAERLLHDGLLSPARSAVHALLDPHADPAIPARLSGLLGIHDQCQEAARLRMAGAAAGDPARAGLAAMLATAEVRALQRGLRDLDWRGLLDLIALARAGLPDAGESLLVLSAVAHIVAAADGEPGHAE